MASEDSKSVPDIVVIGCLVILVAVIGGFYYASSINKPTGPHMPPPGFIQHLKQHPGASAGSSPTGAGATNP